jgi:galactokinase
MSPEEQATARFRRQFGGEPEIVVQAPGRVNLIGEHTDYNDGFVLPMAIDRRTVIAARHRTDSIVSVSSEGFSDAHFDLAAMEPAQGWDEYIKGVAWAMDADSLPGWEGVIESTIPLGASLSSSAALEVATALVFATLAKRRWRPSDAAQLAHRAETDWVGVNSGIMDQLISACGQAGHAVLIDCRDLTRSATPLPPGVQVVVLDTGTRRRLTESRYNQRRAECKAAAEAFGIESLRDLTATVLNDPPADLSKTILDRARHVVEENQRTLAAAEAMKIGDGSLLGSLMNQSHESLRDLYEVSSSALDAMVESALASPGCLGARMTGAGFGGCAIALVDDAAVDEFMDNVATRYQGTTRNQPAVYACVAAGAASVIAS